MAERGRVCLLDYIRMKEKFPLESADIVKIKEFAKNEEGYIKALIEDNDLLEQESGNLQAKISRLQEELQFLTDERGETRKIIREELDRAIPIIIDGVVRQLTTKLNPTVAQLIDTPSDGTRVKGCAMDESAQGSSIDGVFAMTGDATNDDPKHYAEGLLGSERHVVTGLVPIEITQDDAGQETRHCAQEPHTRETQPDQNSIQLIPSDEKDDESVVTSPPKTSVLQNVLATETGLDLLDLQPPILSDIEMLDPISSFSPGTPTTHEPLTPSNVVDDLQQMQAKLESDLKARECAIRELEMDDDDF